MNEDEFDKLSDEIKSKCDDYPYVCFHDAKLLCLDGYFTLDDLKMIVSKWSEAIDSESIE